jgi:hypothetical protein
MPPTRREGLRLALIAATLLVAAHGGQARAQGTPFFGPDQGFEIQPEVDVYYHVSEDARLLLEVQGMSIPTRGNGSIAVGAYGDWMLAPFFRNLVSPDQALTRALNLRLGVRYLDTLDPGATGSSQRLAIQLDVTPRYFLPWSILLSNRNRLQAQWQLGEADSFTFRYRGRLQVQREFDVGGVGLTPFVNVEFIWQSPPAMWVQFRMQAGLQASVPWFGRGQTFEVNYSTVTYLQPARTWRPVLGIIWYQYF